MSVLSLSYMEKTEIKVSHIDVTWSATVEYVSTSRNHLRSNSFSKKKEKTQSIN